MKFKINKKLLLINFLILAIVYFCFDFYYFAYIIGKENSQKHRSMKKISYIYKYFKRYNPNYLDEFEAKYITRTNANKELKERFLTNPESKEQPIVVLGCSFAYGEKLDKESAFSGQLAKLTNRPIFNLAFIAGGLQQAIYQLKYTFIKDKIKNPKYVIYVFIPDQINRLYNGCGYTILDYMYYKEKNNKLEINMPYSYITRLPIPFVINTTIKAGIKESLEKRSEYLKQHIKELHSRVKGNWNNTEFIIFSYEYSEELDMLSTYLKENNIKYIKAETIFNEHNIIYDDSFKLPKEVDKFQHPNAKAWEIITPLLLEYIK